MGTTNASGTPSAQIHDEQQFLPCALLIWPCKMHGHKIEKAARPGSAQKSVQSFLELWPFSLTSLNMPQQLALQSVTQALQVLSPPMLMGCPRWAASLYVAR